MANATAQVDAASKSKSVAKAEKAIFAVLIAVLFLVDLEYGLTHHFVDILQQAQSTFGTLMISALFVSWVGGFAYVARRRTELAEVKKARATAEAEAERVGLSDALTELPNRQGSTHELAHRLALSILDECGGALITIDLDRFKMLNDVRGHAIGDEVLIEVSNRLASTVQTEDFVARVGADEFQVLTSLCDTDEVVAFAHRLQDEVARPIHNGPAPLMVRASVGVTIWDAEQASIGAEAMARRGDIALQYAKAEGTSGFACFEPDMEMSIRERAQLERALEIAIDNGEIQPHFQPVIDLQSDRIVGFEVLARWHHPERGSISPTVFIPIAEEMGLLGKLTTVMLRRACAAARDWPADIKLAVNISPIDFKNPWLAQEILQTLVEAGFPPQRLELEITENALVVDHEQAMKTITSLKNQGISIALDDFGTGYSSLHHLRVLPFDKVKIDQSFVKTMRDNLDSRMIVKAIIGLSGSLGLPTTAEGIETNNNADILRDLGCTLGQGFLFSKAVSSQEVPPLLALLKQQREHPELRHDADGCSEEGLPLPSQICAEIAAASRDKPVTAQAPSISDEARVGERAPPRALSPEEIEAAMARLTA